MTHPREFLGWWQLFKAVKNTWWQQDSVQNKIHSRFEFQVSHSNYSTTLTPTKKITLIHFYLSRSNEPTNTWQIFRKQSASEIR